VQRTKNTEYWFEDELFYPLTEFDFGKQAKPLKEKIIPVCGVDNRSVLIYEPNTFLAKYLGTEVFELSGSHLGFATTSKTFAEGLIEK
jgi:hypothetical protein